MDATDLMVGDWVQTKEVHTPDYYQPSYKRRVTQINDFGVELSFLDRYGNNCYVNKKFDHVEAIPLTAEILEKNGFEKFGDNAYSFRRRGGDGEIKIKVIDLTCGEWELYATDYDKYRDSCTSFSKEVSFLKVHELQHALRLCGIEKQIEL